MKIEVNIKKKLGNFNLDINFSSDSLRTGILGRSGCGKSVTLKAIAGIITPDSGRIVINNKVLYDSDKNINLKPQERKVGYLFQNYALFPTMTVEKNISVVIKNKENKKEKVINQKIRTYIKDVGEMPDEAYTRRQTDEKTVDRR